MTCNCCVSNCNNSFRNATNLNYLEFLGALMHQVCVLQSADVESVINRLLTAVRKWSRDSRGRPPRLSLNPPPRNERWSLTGVPRQTCTNKLINNDLQVAYPYSGSSSTWFLVELEFGNAGFWGEGKTGVPGEKPLGSRERTNNKLNPHMASTPGFEPGSHWWEASALTTAPPLLPILKNSRRTSELRQLFWLKVTCVIWNRNAW